MTQDWQQQRRQAVFLGALFEGGLVGLSLGLGWFLDQPPLEHSRWDARDAALGAAASLPLLMVFLLFQRWPLGPLARIKRFWNEVIRPLFASCKLTDLAVISVLAGLGE